MRDLWILFENKTHQRHYLTKSAVEKKVDFMDFCIDDFSIIGEKLLYKNKPVTELPKVVLLRTFVEGQEKIHEYLEKNGVTVIDDLESVNLINDKLRCHEILKENNIAQPKFSGFEKDTTYSDLVKTYGNTFIAKDVYGQCGTSVFLIKSPDDYLDVLKNVEKKNLMFQEYIKQETPQEIRCYVIDGKVVGAVQRVNESGKDFRVNLQNGGMVKPVSKEILSRASESATEIARVLKAKNITVDLMGEGLHFCEANSNGGFPDHETNSPEIVETMTNVSNEMINYAQRVIDQKTQGRKLSSQTIKKNLTMENENG